MDSNTTSVEKQRHVAVLAFPFTSHATHLLEMVERLATDAPTVAFSFFSTTKSNTTLFSVTRPSNIKPYNVSDGVPEGYVFVGYQPQPLQLIQLFLTVAKCEFKKAMEEAEVVTGRRISCLVTDVFLWFSGELAEEMRVPWVPFRTSGAASLFMHIYTHIIRQMVGHNETAVGREDETVKVIPGFPAVRLGDLPTGVLYGENPMEVLLQKVGQVLPRATGLIINSIDEMEPEITADLKTKFQVVLNIGPLALITSSHAEPSDEYGCMPWLDNHNPGSVAYIAFGTLAALPRTELLAFAEALEETKTPFLWSLKDNMKSLLPEGFGKKFGKIVPWTPQVQVLAHASVGVFITHGGWSSVLESIVAGVPMIGRPFFGEQHFNTWMVEEILKIGVRVEGGVFTKSGIASVLDQILSQEKGKKLKKQILVYRDLAIKAVGANGSSTKNLKTLLDFLTNG